MGCVGSRPQSIQPGPSASMTPSPSPPPTVRAPSRSRSWTLHAFARRRSSHKRGKRFTREQRQLIKKYLPSIPIFELSMPLHVEIAGQHWSHVYREGTLSNMSTNSKSSWGRESAHKQPSSVASPIRQLYDTFYVYLEEHAPDLMPVFRASMHVRSKVLVHISAGMRSILVAKQEKHDVIAKLTQLTQTHLRVGVKLEHFDPLARALFFAMEKTSGESWTPEIEHAWRRLFVHCSALLMVEQKKSTPNPRSMVSAKSKGPGQLTGTTDLYSSPARTSIWEHSSIGRLPTALILTKT